jgi:prepilin-type processing-associated H-X9-DG protein
LSGICFANSKIRMKHVTDGTAKTLLVGELALVVDIMAGQAVGGGDTATQKHDNRGRYWSAHQGNALFSTLYPPNSTVGDRGTWCIDTRPVAPCQSTGADNVVNSLRSHHSGGVQAAMVDGSVHFLTDEIDAELYRSFGTRSGDETSASPL